MESVTLAELESFLEPDMESPAGESEIDPLEGFGFYPTDYELITILEYKRSNPDVDLHCPIVVAKIYEYEPSQIPGLQIIQTGGKWWNFFCEPIPLHASGGRFSRATATGYWKATGKPAEIKAQRTYEVIGEKRTLVFHVRNRDSNGRLKEERTNWVMRQYSAKDNPLFKKDLVICRIKLKKDKTRPVSTKNKRAKRPLASTNNEGRSKRRTSTKNENKQTEKHLVAVENSNDAVEMSPLAMQLLPNCHLIPTSISHDVAETISPQPPLLPSCNVISNSRGDTVENTYPSVSNSKNPAIENTSQVDPHPSVSNSASHTREDTSQVECLPVEDPNALNGSTMLDQTSNFTLQPPILPEQGSSHNNVSSKETDLWNYIGRDLDSLLQLPSLDEFLSQDEFLPHFLAEETRHGTCSSFITPTY